MRYVVEDLDARILAALAGAVEGERQAGVPTGAALLLAAAESAAATGGYDPDDLRTRSLDARPPSGLAGVLLPALAYGLLTPADRPTLRRSAHRVARLAQADEGTAMTAVAAAVLAADLLRFDLDWCLTRLHQTLLEEAPSGLLHRLQPLPDDAPLRGDADPGAALQIAITALVRTDATVPAVLEELLSYGEDLSVALSLAAALAGAHSGSGAGIEPPPEPVRDVARALARRTRELLPSRPEQATAIESPSHDQR
ncbi:MAG TPA: hypothetical protein VN193_03175 [Candidatus Angelobacter sp.]|jgi:hypothetical protein|nr:hypothetical protein [Candidatus Angelobacter sp.]